MNIVLLGGSGFVGSKVAKILRNKGHNVATPTHQELDLLNPNRQNIEKIFHNQNIIIRSKIIISCVSRSVELDFL